MQSQLNYINVNAGGSQNTRFQFTSVKKNKGTIELDGRINGWMNG